VTWQAFLLLTGRRGPSTLVGAPPSRFDEAVGLRPTSPILTFLGAAGTVTGSRFLVEHRDVRVLFDAGMFQGFRELRELNRAPFLVEPATLDAVVITHAHLDHCGYLPALVRGGFHGPVYVTANTAALAQIVLRDAAYLQEEDADYANRKGYSRHHPALPLYTTADAEAAIGLFRTVEVGRPTEVADGVRVTMRHAGHILGAASILAELPRNRTLFVSGDVGRPEHPLLRPPDPFPDVDVALVESTYGDGRHAPEAEAVEQLAQLISRTAARGGIVLIPAFAVDRTEIILRAIRGLRRAERIPSLPVYVDSPMALDVLGVYRRAISNGDPELLPIADDPDPFDPGGLREARALDASIALTQLNSPSIIISAAGMATGGRVVHHLSRRLPDPRNAVALVGYQAGGTRGRLLADGARTIKMLGRHVPVRAEIRVIDGFSVHADGDELVEWMRPARAPDATYVVHGEPGASATLRDRLDTELGWLAVVPHHGERVRLD
jgi:metallo-beta-lactamase family protein